MQISQAYDQTLETALAWHDEGRGAALATVIETWGSAPRRIGSQLAISGRGEIEGSVSGGCVEGAVVAEALAMLDGQSEPGAGRVLTYGVSDEDAFAVGLACGGTIRILVEPLDRAVPVSLLKDIAAARAARKAVGYEVNTQSWQRRLIGAGDAPERFRADRSGFAEDAETFTAIYNPPLRLAVVGAVHIAQPLMAMARLSGYDAVLIDPRDAFGAQDRFPGERIMNDWPDEALDAFGLDVRTAVVTLTHDAKLDDPAIRRALNSDIFYLGCLGSTRTHAKRVARLQAEGFTEAQIARIHAPVGLAIGAASPAEIALSILAEITQVLRKGASEKHAG